MSRRFALASALAILCSHAFSASGVYAAGLTAYCPMSEDDCGSVLRAFKADTGVEAQFVRIGAGEILARIRAEKNNPQAGLWLAGAADNFIQAASEGLLAPHKAIGIDKVEQNYTDRENRWTPISLSPIVFAYSTQVLDELKAKPPTSWKSFADPAFKQSVALAHPAASGTAYVALASMVQLFGEQPAFQLMRDIDKNVVQYTRSGVAPSRMVANNEIALAMAFTQDIEAALAQGYPVGYSFPEEGTGFEVNAAAAIANAPADQATEATAFLDWILTDRGQAAMGATFRGPIVPGYKNPNAKIDLTNVKMIDYNFGWAGENRARLLDLYEKDVRHKADAK
ncbi:ABC transporter substrate-binding protein [Agrobacterium tumefaciens]|jgi:iron(III) transport system substrate-binding protein|uniref:ABC transporter substrate-binding protein n=1 Tax=Agrobacterium tumefaciens TaxID=358 RepID=UPI000DD07824|nr:iron(III) transport system substrate-binding protein [Rhizobium nepotum]UXU08413.1 ABC transporter substrate-binding protein [Agrobacterium tumefaciens]